MGYKGRISPASITRDEAQNARDFKAEFALMLPQAPDSLAIVEAAELMRQTYRYQYFYMPSMKHRTRVRWRVVMLIATLEVAFLQFSKEIPFKDAFALLPERSRIPNIAYEHAVRFSEIIKIGGLGLVLGLPIGMDGM